MARLSGGAGRSFTTLVIGMVMGGAAALLAGALLADQSAAEALRLDRTAAVAEAAGALHASLNQAGLVVATVPDADDRAARLAMDEIGASQQSLERAVEALGPADAALANAADGYLVAATEFARELSRREAMTADPGAVGLAYRTLTGVVEDQRRSSLTLVTTSAKAGTGATAVLATALLLVLPALAVYIIARSIPRSVAPATPSPASAPLPIRLVAELEERAAALTDHARRMTWLRSDDRELAPYRSLLAEATGMSVTARNLLALERLERREILVTSEPTDLTSIADRIRSATVDLGWDLEVVLEPVMVLADPVRVQQIVENLLSVLVGCGAERIALILGRNGVTGSISVAGNDCSLARESLRMANGLPGVPQRGAGLALAVSRGLLESMEGDLRHSEVGGTTMFTVELPLARIG